MKPKTIDLNIENGNRMLFISDIHGDYSGFKSILDKVSFAKDDYLFIIGDIIEKGDENLLLLDYIMYLIDEGYKVYPISGNCDTVIYKMIPPVTNDLLLEYALIKKHSIINEFANRLNISIMPDTDFNNICEIFQKNFKKYYDFLMNLPHIIKINNKIILVHGGIVDINNVGEEVYSLMKMDNFYFESPKQDKLMIVGHYPTINYQLKYPDINPIIDLEKNIISIDGGNVVVPWGQLNMLVIDNINDMNITYIRHDSFDEAIVLEDIISKESEILNIIMHDNDVEIIRELEDYYICRHINRDVYLPILKKLLFYNPKRNVHYSYDAFKYFPSLKKDEKVKIIYEASPYSIIKKDGIIGLVPRSYIRRL